MLNYEQTSNKIMGNIIKSLVLKQRIWRVGLSYLGLISSLPINQEKYNNAHSSATNKMNDCLVV